MPGALIVDDSAVMREFLRDFVEHETPFRVCAEAANAIEAIDQATKLSPELLLIDLIMPQMNGLTTSAIIKQIVPSVKIVLFTLSKQELSPAMLRGSGVDLVFTKSDNINGLATKLRSLLGVAEPPSADAATTTTAAAL